MKSNCTDHIYHRYILPNVDITQPITEQCNISNENEDNSDYFFLKIFFDVDHF